MRDAERLRREARALAALDHPNIVTIYDIISENGRDVLVMELLDGVTLAQRRERGPMDAAEGRRIIASIADALAAAHAVGIVHRDLKPSNVVLTGSGVRVVDFGLAQRPDESRLTQEGVVMGSSRALAPEQARGELARPSSDVFALGSLAYELLSGVHPFAADDPFETMRRVAAARPRPLEEVACGVDPDLVALVHQMLHPDPAARPPAHDVASALKTVQDDPRTRRPVRLARTAVLALCAVVLLAVGGHLFVKHSAGPDGDGQHIAIRPALDRHARVVRAGLTTAVASGPGVSVEDAAHMASLAWAPADEVARVLGSDQLIDVATTSIGVVVRRFIPHHGWSLVGSPIPVGSADHQAWQAGFRIGGAVLNESVPLPVVGTVHSAAIASFLDIEQQVRHGRTHPRGDVLATLKTIHHTSPGLVDAALLESEVAHALWAVDPTRDELLRRAQDALVRVESIAPSDGRCMVRRLNLQTACRGRADTRLIDAAVKRLPAHPSAPMWASVFAGVLPPERLDEQLVDRLSAPSLAALAHLEQAHGLHHRAEAHRAKAVDRGGYSPVNLASAASRELDRGDPKEAEAWLRSLRRRLPHPVVDLHLGIARILQGDLAGGCHTIDAIAPHGVDATLEAWRSACRTWTGHATVSLLRAQTPTPPADGATLAEQIGWLWNHALTAPSPSIEARGLLLELHADPPKMLRARVLIACADAAIGERELARATLKRALQDGASRHWRRLPWFGEEVSSPSQHGSVGCGRADAIQ